MFGSLSKDLVVAVAIIWATVIVSVTRTVGGTAYEAKLLPLLLVAAASTVILVGVGVKLLD